MSGSFVRGLTQAQRFWRTFALIDKGPGCWEWPGPRNREGYGLVHVLRDGKDSSTTASRMFWELTNGPIPEGSDVCHHCDNPPCLRPEHLFLGTHAENIRDAQKKGRVPIRVPPLRNGRAGVRGENSWCAKLTDHLVAQIREAYASGDFLMRELAERHGVDLGTVSRVINRKLWRHVA
jgi:hypothetical protein